MKTNDEEILEYDEDEAVKFIIDNTPKEYKGSITDEKVEYVLDLVYEYYEENGFIDDEKADESTIDEEDIFNYITKTAHKEKFGISDEEIELILDGEFEYGKSIGIYTEED